MVHNPTFGFLALSFECCSCNIFCNCLKSSCTSCDKKSWDWPCNLCANSHKLGGGGENKSHFRTIIYTVKGEEELFHCLFKQLSWSVINFHYHGQHFIAIYLECNYCTNDEEYLTKQGSSWTKWWTTSLSCFWDYLLLWSMYKIFDE